MRFPLLSIGILATLSLVSIPGFGQAIPVPIATERPDGWLGVVLDDSEGHVTADRVLPHSPAADGGLLRGDVIFAVNGASVRSSGTTVALVREVGAGAIAELSIRRGELELTLAIELTERPARSELTGLLIGSVLPWHETTDVRTGRSVDAPGADGRWTIVEFWATWCGPCALARPRFEAIVERGEAAEVRFISVAYDAEADLRSFLDQHPHHWEQVADPDDVLGGPALLVARPSWFVVDPDGIVRATYVGLGGVDDLATALDGIRGTSEAGSYSSSPK